MRHQRGFSLVELLIVVAVILVLSALAIPQLLRARISANEASAVASVRSIHTAELEYAQYYPTVGYADDISKLGPPPPNGATTPTQAGLLDFVLGCSSQPCPKTGYLFSVDQTAGSPVDTFRITAVPQAPGKSGQRGFCGTVPGVISFDPNGGTACTSPI